MSSINSFGHLKKVAARKHLVQCLISNWAKHTITVLKDSNQRLQGLVSVLNPEKEKAKYIGQMMADFFCICNMFLRCTMKFHFMFDNVLQQGEKQMKLKIIKCLKAQAQMA